MTSNAHPYDPATVLAPLGDAFQGPAIFTRYKGGSNRIVATHKRALGETERVTVPYQPGWDAERNHRAAAEKLAAAMGHGPRVLVARGHDHDCYVWVSVGLWQVEPAVLALEAARELEAITAGFPADPESPFALALALARMATGTDHPRPIVAGWAMGPAAAPGGVILTDVMGDPIEGLSFPDSLSAAGALAAAMAAGWLLTAPMRATAARLRNVCGAEPDPAAVSVALAALVEGAH